MSYLVDLTGRRFGRWIVLNRTTNCSDRDHHTRWNCKCDCGTHRMVIGTSLSNGQSRSCGCALFMPARQTAFNKVLHAYRMSAKSRGLPFRLNLIDFTKLTMGSCFYCGAEPAQISIGTTKAKGKYVYNGIDRVDPFRGYEKDNCVSCCSKCNLMKLDHHLYEFLDHIEHIYYHMKGKVLS